MWYTTELLKVSCAHVKISHLSKSVNKLYLYRLLSTCNKLDEKIRAVARALIGGGGVYSYIRVMPD